MPIRRWTKRSDLEGGFWSKVDRSGGGDACWPWLAFKEKNGYGKFKWKGKKTPAHRVAFEIANKRAPTSGMDICHRCNFRSCCNPKHLYEGTRSQNMLDAVAAGTLVQAGFSKIWSFPGETHPRAKLTDALALEICRRALAGESTRALSREYGIGHSTIIDLKQGRRYVSAHKQALKELGLCAISHSTN